MIGGALRTGPGAAAVVGLGLLVAACGGDGPAPQVAMAVEPPPPAHQLIFAYDRSTSITAEELSVYQTLTGQSVDYLDHRDRLVAIGILQLSLTETPDRWQVQVPDREFADRELQSDSTSLVRFRRDARDYLRRFTKTEDREGYLGTDILSTLFDVAAEVQAYPDHKATVILFSDMLQATEDINMEGMTNAPPESWVATRKAEGRLPDLSGACIVVAGARTDTAEGQRVKKFWQDYFQAAGATLLDRNYSYRPVRIPQDPCA
jgi:hypothetical protein